MTTSFKTLKITLSIILLVSIFGLFVAPPVTQAINLDDARAAAVKARLNVSDTSFIGILGTILRALLSLAFLLAIIFVVISGYQMITSRGNEEQVTKAKQALLWAVLGMIVIALSWVILSFVIVLASGGAEGTGSSGLSPSGGSPEAPDPNDPPPRNRPPRFPPGGGPLPL